MRVGVTNFEPARLSEALKFKLWTKSKLADEIGKSPSAITGYLSGTKPSPEAFEKIAEVLKIPTKFFLTPPISGDFNNSLKQWRSLSKHGSADRLRGESLLAWVVETHSVFRDIFAIPQFDLLGDPSVFELPDDFREITTDHIDFAASKLRQIWGLGELPIKNLTRTAERSGIVVATFDLKVRQLDAVSTVFDGTPYVLLNTFKQSGCRARFDLAHEIGHIILHRNVTTRDLIGKDGKAIYAKLEKDAHWFAGALLLPANRFTKDFWAPTWQCFLDMKRKWKVSIQAMMHRALDLELINESQYNWLNIKISKDRARIVEPLDDVIPRESIRLFPKCFERYAEDFGKEGVADLIGDRLPFPNELIEEMCGLEHGYFASLDQTAESDGDTLIQFDFRNRFTPQTSSETSA